MDEGEAASQVTQMSQAGKSTQGCLVTTDLQGNL